MKNRDILNIQNEEHFINLLKAQRIAYSHAKRYLFIDLISIIIAIALPVIAISNPNLINMMSAIGVVWTIIYLIVESFRKKKTIEVAKIQEQFDTELFDIENNPTLIKDKINPDKIYDLSIKNKEEDSLKNWYSWRIRNELPKNIKILLCQRINSSWELDLRKRFVFLLIFALILYYGLFLILLLVKNTGIYDILLLLSPSISFLVYGVQHSIALNKQITSKNELLTTIDEYLTKYQKKKEMPKETKIRRIQDMIYLQRTVPEKIPNWFYKIFRTYNENKTDKLIQEITKNI